MAKDIFQIEIKCSEDSSDLNVVDDILCTLHGRGVHKQKRWKELYDELHTELDTLYKNRGEKRGQLYEFFNTKLNEYWEITVEHILNGKVSLEKYLIYPYSFLEINSYMAAIRTCNLYENNSSCTVSDGGFMIDDFIRNGETTITLKSISKREFINTINSQCVDVIENRLQKNKTKKELENKTHKIEVSF